MKRISRIVLATFMVFLCHGIALGEANPFLDAVTKAPNPKNRLLAGLTDGRLSVNAGYKMWVAKWKTFNNVLVNDFSFASNTAVIDTEVWSKTTIFSGPTVTANYRLRKGEWFHSIGANFTWLLAGGFKFNNDRIVLLDSGGPIFGAGAIAPTKRRDYSITGSLAIWRGLGIFGGYYHNLQNFRGNSFWYSGPLIGAYGSGKVTKRVGIYGNVAVGFFDLKTSLTDGGNGTLANGVQGYSTEWGVNLNGPDVWKIGTGLQVGYRAQAILFQESFNRELSDITIGPIFTLLAKF